MNESDLTPEESTNSVDTDNHDTAEVVQEQQNQEASELSEDAIQEQAALTDDQQVAPEVESEHSNETANESEGSSESEEQQPEHLAELKLQAKQGEMPFALVQGEAMTQLPLDLYIPPDALEVILEQFEGPLDLLLYLIRKQNLDILDVNVAEITKQYMHYIEVMQALQLELAGEYLVMAAMLAEIKSRMLLPRSSDEEEEEESDPRAELIRRLQEYERFKDAAETLDASPQVGRDIFLPNVNAPERNQERVHPDVDMKEIMLAMGAIMRRAERFEKHEVQFEVLPTRERMTNILTSLSDGHFRVFSELFTPEEGRLGVVVTFLAMLELVKEKLIDIVQQETFGPIHVKAKADAPSQLDESPTALTDLSELDSAGLNSSELNNAGLATE